MTQQYDNKGQIALWKNPQHEPTNNRPVFKGNVVLDGDYREGDKILISLWHNQSDNESAPMFTGKAERPDPKFAKNAPVAELNQPAAEPDEPVDDSIPF